MPNPSSIETLITNLAKLPGVGKRSARRMALQLIRKRDALIPPLISALQDAYDNITSCEICYNLDSCSPCHICAGAKRDPSIICVVEDLADLWAMERSAAYRGMYHVLGGTLSAIDGRSPEHLHIPKLVARAKEYNVREVILATNATMDGQTTAHYIAELLEDADVDISRLAQGIPMGGELDYLDDGTLGAALMARLKA
jgi:recombination protein RecR